ncbi:hypothetical protein G7Y79_00002g008180 [Physcia stellaris]|nr:hypothetical protein G7Y79_00002g008180 [Physcia stellaris]
MTIIYQVRKVTIIYLSEMRPNFWVRKVTLIYEPPRPSSSLSSLRRPPLPPPPPPPTAAVSSHPSPQSGMTIIYQVRKVTIIYLSEMRPNFWVRKATLIYAVTLGGRLKLVLDNSATSIN